MNQHLLAKILIVLLLFGSNAVTGSAQNGETAAIQPPGSAEIVQENDRLPFMRNETAEPVQSGAGSLLFKTLGAMLLIVGLLFFGAWGLKKTGFDRFKRGETTESIDLAVLSSVPMGGGRTISAVRFGERVLLVGSTAQAFTLLADEPLKEKTTQPPSRSVAEMLGEQKSESFGGELETAQNRLEVWGVNGGRLK